LAKSSSVHSGFSSSIINGFELAIFARLPAVGFAKADYPNSSFPQRRAGVNFIAVMPNRNLSVDELKLAHELLSEIREKLDKLAAGDPLLRFAYRRKVVKELGYDERGKPLARAKLKALKWGLQKGRCAECGEELRLEYSELDRKNAPDGYTAENTELVHAKCHQARQAAKRYT
jgi:hypothetical protein